MALKSQINACASSPAEHMWHEECGAQAKVLTELAWRFNSATGNVGNRMSIMATTFESMPKVAMYRGSCLFQPKRSKGTPISGFS